MDYKYIEQLLERYWQCETTIEEENILKAFFSQKELPENLLRYRSLFAYEKEAAEKEVLGDDFDARMLALVEDDDTQTDGQKTCGRQPIRVKAHPITLRDRLMPLFKAAAVVAVIISLGNAAQFSFNDEGTQQEDGINYANYKDTYTDPSRAYDKVENALELVSEGINQAAVDTAAGMQAPTGIPMDGKAALDNDSTKRQ